MSAQSWHCHGYLPAGHAVVAQGFGYHPVKRRAVLITTRYAHRVPSLADTASALVTPHMLSAVREQVLFCAKSFSLAW